MLAKLFAKLAAESLFRTNLITMKSLATEEIPRLKLTLACLLAGVLGTFVSSRNLEDPTMAGGIRSNAVLYIIEAGIYQKIAIQMGQDLLDQVKRGRKFGLPEQGPLLVAGYLFSLASASDSQERMKQRMKGTVTKANQNVLSYHKIFGEIFNNDFSVIVFELIRTEDDLRVAASGVSTEYKQGSR